MDSFLSWLRQLRLDGIWQTAVVVCASLLCITVHETCHGLVAFWLGDRTAKNQGRLTLNPLKHVDLGGLLMMAIFHFGWAKPVPINMRNFKNPKTGMALTALAGPLSNVVLAFLALVCYMLTMRISGAQAFRNVLSIFFSSVALISTGLAVFNIFPIPPLDGSKVLFSLLPDRVYLRVLRYERYGMFLLMALLFLGVIDGPLAFLRDGLLNLLVRAAAAIAL